MPRLDHLLVALVLAGCDRGPPPRPPVPVAPLYERVGGITALRGVVDELAVRLAADPTLAPAYAETDFRAYKKDLLVELCRITGGPCRVERPAGAAADEVVTRGWLDHLTAAALATGVDPDLQAELVRRIERRAAELAAGGAPR